MILVGHPDLDVLGRLTVQPALDTYNCLCYQCADKTAIAALEEVLMSVRLKITIVHGGETRTFDQLAEGESRDEFRSRARCAMNIPEGDEYVVFEQEGHKYRGPVSEHCHGMKKIHHVYAQDERLPGLFVLRRGKIYDYSAAPKAVRRPRAPQGSSNP